MTNVPASTTRISAPRQLGSSASIFFDGFPSNFTVDATCRHYAVCYM